MESQTKHSRWSRCIPLAALIASFCFAVGSAATEAQAGKPGSLDFTIKAEDDGLSNTYTATGAIEDEGWYVVGDDDRYVDENGDIWTRLRFLSYRGTFFTGWLPPDFEPRVEYEVELMPGAGAYSDVRGTCTVKFQVRNVYGWTTGGWGGKKVKVLLYSIEYVTVKGTLLP